MISPCTNTIAGPLPPVSSYSIVPADSSTSGITTSSTYLIDRSSGWGAYHHAHDQRARGAEHGEHHQGPHHRLERRAVPPPGLHRHRRQTDRGGGERPVRIDLPLLPRRQGATRGRDDSLLRTALHPA